VSDTLKFDLRDWLVPPVLLPIFFCAADRCRRDYSVVVRLE
jgi:hypothetical protein